MGFESNKLEKPFENRHHYTFVNSVHKWTLKCIFSAS
jgi:hypothetical protein